MRFLWWDMMQNNVVLYDPAVGQTYKRTTADADEMFFNAGNIFFTYQK